VRIAVRRSRVVDRPPGGAEWDGDEVKEGTDIKRAGQTAGVERLNGGASGRGLGF
jgi:hypothetical protein